MLDLVPVPINRDVVDPNGKEGEVLCKGGVYNLTLVVYNNGTWGLWISGELKKIDEPSKVT